LHPRILFEDIEFLSEYPVKLFQGDIAEVIPLSFLYVAVCSATIRMALVCGIPVVNYDVYQYHYDDYDDLDGVLTMQKKGDFKKALSQLCCESGFYEKIQSAQQSQSSQWGVLDGKAGEKLLQEIDLLFT
jgi:hypothetical protein